MHDCMHLSGALNLQIDAFMDILFKTEKLARLCSQERLMSKALGQAGAKKLKARLADLMAASHMRQVRRGRPHVLTGSMQGCMALDLDGGRRLVLEPAMDPTPRFPDGGVDWSRVRAVRILCIGDYHG